MSGLFSGSKKLYLYADGEKEIIDAVTTAKENGIENLVLVGGYEAHKIIPFLKQHNVPVLVQHTHNLPSKADDDYDLPYKLAKIISRWWIIGCSRKQRHFKFPNQKPAFLCRTNGWTGNGKGNGIAAYYRKYRQDTRY